MMMTIPMLLILGSVGGAISWGEIYNRVRLQDIQILTLKNGEMTTGRRSSPIPQLKCVGGSAQGMFTPAIVQCYNRGWDGRDIQWECKSDMDNRYRIGEVEVVCEGFDYSGDPYILAGSCGLKYTLDLTLEGRDGYQRSNHDYYGGNSGNSYDRARLQDIQVLTLKCGKMTTSRRSCPIPQLKCVGGSAQGKFTPSVVQCYNRGWDGRNIQWECKSDMDNRCRFGEMKVVCEGFDFVGDPYILAGSCGLEYTLDLTLEGRERHKHRHKRRGHDYYCRNSGEYSSGYGVYGDKTNDVDSIWLEELIVLAVLCVVICKIFFRI